MDLKVAYFPLQLARTSCCDSVTALKKKQYCWSFSLVLGYAYAKVWDKWGLESKRRQVWTLQNRIVLYRACHLSCSCSPWSVYKCMSVSKILCAQKTIFECFCLPLNALWIVKKKMGRGSCSLRNVTSQRLQRKKELSRALFHCFL